MSYLKFLILYILLFYTQNAFSQVWSKYSPISNGTVKHNDITIINQVPYAVYSDGTNSDKISVKRYVNNNWETVGQLGFSVGAASYISICNDGISPIVSYRDGGLSYKLVIKKFTNNVWENLGNATLSSGSIENTHLKFSSNKIYVLYTDQSLNEKLVCKVYENGSWNLLGSEGFTTGSGRFGRLELIYDIPYVVFQDNSNGGKTTVLKFEDSEWKNVGQAAFSDGNSAYHDITSVLSSPVVVYSDLSRNWGGIDIKIFDGNNWNSINLTGLPTISIANINLKWNYDALYLSFRTSDAYFYKYGADGWSSLGTPASIASSVNYLKMAFDSNNIPHVFSDDLDDLGKGTLSKLTYPVLPVNLSDFSTSISLNSNVEVIWSTNRDNNNGYFILERKTLNTDFIKIFETPSSNKPDKYKFTDRFCELGTNYYRLSHIDFDGKKKEIGVKYVTIDNLKKDVLNIYPNPVSDILYINADDFEKKPRNVRILDINGKVIFEKTTKNKTIKINIADGTYILFIEGYSPKKIVVKN